MSVSDFHRQDSVMTSPLSPHRVHELVSELRRLTAERAKAEAEVATAGTTRTSAIRRTFEAERDRIEARCRVGREAADQEVHQSRDHVLAKSDQGLKAAKNECGTAREEALERYQDAEEMATHTYQEARWTQDAVLEARTKKAQGLRDQARRRAAGQQETADTIRAEALERLHKWRLIPPGAGATPSDAPLPNDPAPLADAEIATARERVGQLNGLIGPRLLVVDRFLLGAFVVWTTLALLGFVVQPWYLGPVVATVLTPLAAVGLWFGLRARMRGQAARIGKPLFSALAEAGRMRNRSEELAESHYRQDVDEGRQHHRDEVRAAEKRYRKQLADVLQERDDAVQGADARLAKLTADFTTYRERELARIETEYNRRRSALQAERDREMATMTERYERERAEVERTQIKGFATLAATWHHGVERLQSDFANIAQQNAALFPDWSGPAWVGWSAPTAVPGGLRLGDFAVDVTALPGGQPSDDRLQHFVPDQLTLPALLPFPQRCATLLHTADVGRTAAVQALQALMLRFLTALPPGKVRFTIIDPVGLGENFAAFMHLADYDEQLVGSRIWTETHQIEKRLADLTEHMENVIQKYLRNQYKSIEEYNRQAGEVAEPYRVLVVANFPANFSLEAARRLVSIAASGAGCGVYTLVSVDTKAPLPQGFPLSDLEMVSENLSWHAGRWQWEDADLGAYPLTLDAPPDAAAVARIVQTVGAQAKEASRVEVDFEFIAPPPERWWAGDSRAGIDVPLGRAGATKRQHLRLGQGTSQHVLVAGKTGSGKSTLLHALITNLALNYGPDEVELYLIDFKKGVEFKTYATHELPHARVVAVESEREFGLSVLQRLDAELRRRGDLFRTAGVQDIGSYRDRHLDRPNHPTTQPPNHPTTLPRILLVVDEFQEFFVEDDRISQDAALLLDRLVRQGRAFGLHVLLGSQTLGGAYSLARSTIDQMAIRIALQCSEADANLILSKDNNAARLLSRPGEAIYNDANGLIEGNDVFQVVWLPEERRERYLEGVQSLARRQGWQPPTPAVVFEGNHPADIESNHRLRRLLDQGGATEPVRERVAWLGDALAIKDPTAAAFSAQSGSSLLILGQQPEPARAVLTAVVVALAAQHASGDGLPDGVAPLTLLDGSPGDDPHAGYFAKVAAHIPGRVRLTNLRERPSALELLVEELRRRQHDSQTPGTPLFLAVYGLHRFRDLRKREDDFGFSRREEEKPATPADLFAELVREGPAAGIHLLVWCDTLTNAQRTLDRSGLREFAMRVLFQMSVTDSSALIDSPMASRLHQNRVLFASEELGALEKFRPYSLPTEQWLARVASHLGQPTALSPA
jgi:hypothetical protein